VRIWQVEELGEPQDALSLKEVPRPQALPGTAVVDVRACSLNFPDVLLCRGKYQVRPPLPFTPGLECAGVVRELGTGVTGVAVGQRVIALPALPDGALCESVRVAGDALYPIPDSLSDEEAACLFATYQTAWFSLHRRGGLRSGETVLVHAGAGGVGSAAIQLAKAAGARVLATAGGPEKVAACVALGADLGVDYRTDDFVPAVMDATDGRGVDVVFDPVGGETLHRSLKCMAWEGRLLVVGFAGGEIPEVPANRVLLKNISLVGVHWGPYLQHSRGLVDDCHDTLMDLHAAGRVKPLVTARAPFEEAPQALAALAARETYGKTVICP